MRLAKIFKFWKMARTIKELGHPCYIACSICWKSLLFLSKSKHKSLKYNSKNELWACKRYTFKTSLCVLSKRSQIQFLALLWDSSPVENYSIRPLGSIIGSLRDNHVVPGSIPSSVVRFFSSRELFRPASWLTNRSLFTNHDFPGLIPGCAVGFFASRGWMSLYFIVHVLSCVVRRRPLYSANHRS